MIFVCKLNHFWYIYLLYIIINKNKKSKAKLHFINNNICIFYLFLFFLNLYASEPFQVTIDLLYCAMVNFL